ncbi:MAG TPA: NAD(P)-binding protein, partial [Actinomycetales bacterium]|nr:NAD(P)-binding protein [Actinomycetales bacterium]
MRIPAPALVKYLPLSAVPAPRRTVAGDPRHIVVVGAGLAGLTAALHLLGSGRKVTVVEAADHVGGRCATEDVEVPGAGVTVRADTGATVWTMPSLVESALAAVGFRVSDVDPSFRVERMSPAYHARFHDGRDIDVHSDVSAMSREVARFAMAGGATDAEAADLVAGYLRLRDWAAEVFASSFPHFMDASFDSPLNMVGDSGSAGDLGHLAQLGAFGGLERKVRSLLGDDLLARVFSFQALYAGVAPAKARAVYGCISHMDTGMGVHYPVDSASGSGMGAVPGLLADAFVKAGGKLRLSTRVAGVRMAGDVVGAVLADDG